MKEISAGAIREELKEMFRLWLSPSFAGGFRARTGNELSESLPIADYSDPVLPLVFPMLQHQGIPCKPLVAVGDRVLKNQVIGAPPENGVPIFSSVSGTVRNIRPVPHPLGDMVTGVIIDNDHLFETASYPYEPCDPFSLDRQQILDRVRYAGLVGMGGAGYPTYLKLDPGEDKPIRHILINSCESEPYVTGNFRLLVEEPDKMLDGLKILMFLFPEAEGVICMENDKPDAYRRLKEFVAVQDNIRVVTLQAKYPQGSEKQLIHTVTGAEIPTGSTPADLGCLVLNLETLLAVSAAVREGHPLLEKVVTITGDCVSAPKNFRVPLGTSMKELLEQTGELLKDPERIVCGGPIMGTVVNTADIPVIKTSSCLLLLSEDITPPAVESECIRCGKCLQVCPMRLRPSLLNKLVLAGDIKGFEAAYGMNCIECGACQYICPAGRLLLQTCLSGKRAVIEASGTGSGEATS
ncbi:MAG: electron transport complex subunit RsxC [Lachnospiraceae bacterium]|nr:electron transport complex subunit RsxC [Lachnospiraceae bacterium]